MAVENPYEMAGAALIASSGCNVRKYRTSPTGTAYTQDDDWGIEVPRPRGPISFGVFAHEVGHQLMHRSNSKPRWVEEVEAEEFALLAFARFSLDGSEKYERRAAEHLSYSFWKAVRRSERLLAVIPEAYPEWWPMVIATETWSAKQLIERGAA